MKDHWYCQVDGEQFGPFEWDQMRAMAAEGRLVPESQVRREVDQRWFAAGKIPGLMPEAKTGDDSSAAGCVTTKARPAESAGESVSTAVATAAPPTAPDKSKSNGHAPPARANARAAVDQSPTRLKVAAKGLPTKPRMPATDVEPVPPPPVVAGKVATSGVQSSPPLPVPAADASPLGIVVAPPVSAPSKPNKSAGKVSLPLAGVKDEHGLSTLLVGGVVGGVALVLVAIGGGVVAWQWSQRGNQQVATKLETKEEVAKPAISDAELDAILGPIKPPEPTRPAEPAKPVEPPSAPAVAATAPQPPANPQVAAAKKLLAAQPKWIPIEGVVIRGREIEVEVAQIWLASDEKGTRVDPVLPSSAPTAADVSAAKSPGQFIFVDVRVSNRGPIPRKYTSWNTGGKVVAILADPQGEPLALVPPADTPSVTRFMSLHIPAGQAIGDVLVFRAPERPFESLKLLLSQAAFATAGRHFALEVPVEFLFKQAEGLPPQTALAADDDVPAEGGAQSARKRIDPNAPPTVEEFTKSLEGDKKMLDKRNATDDAPAKPEIKG